MDKKRKNVLILIGLLTILLVLIGTTYAYFVAQTGKGGTAQINATTGTTDLLTFANEGNINITADANNFQKDGNSITQSAKVSATLTPNNTNNKATYYYNVYLILENNELEYTTEDKQPELIVKITNPKNTLVESISGLSKCKEENTDSFDITNQKGVFEIARDYEITATGGPITQEWQVEVTFVNLKTDQNNNTGKNVKGRVLITKEEIDTNFVPEINSIATTITYNSVKVVLNTTPGTNPISKYYYAYKKQDSEDELSYVSSTEDNFLFENLDPETEYFISIYMVDDKNNISNKYETTIITDNYTLPKVDDISSESTLDSIKVIVSATPGIEDEENPITITSYFYSINNDEFIEKNENTYTFSSLEKNKEYTIRVKVKDSNGKESPEYTHKIFTKKINNIDEFCSANEKITDCITKLQASGSFEQTGLVKHNTMLLNSAEDDSIRYAGTNPNNFVCFKDSSENCSFSELYRIIGIFENEDEQYEAKLIKADYATSTDLGLSKSPSTIIPSKPFEYKGQLSEIETFPWSGSGQTVNNTWNESSLKESLNKSYYDSLSFQDLIKVNKWVTNGGSYREIVESNFQMAYKYEMGKFDSPATYSANIGLMYVSDYYYGSDPSYWSLKGTEISKSRYHNWMHLGLRDLTISKTTSEDGYVFTFEADGHVAETKSSSYNFPVRPTFYLNNDVKYVKGNGNVDSPIYLKK